MKVVSANVSRRLLFKSFISMTLSCMPQAAVAGTSSVIGFPNNFKWCAATAAHQIEGHNTHSDWANWEKIKGNTRNGETSEIADDHWNRVSEDIELMHDMGITQYRMSIEWARIEPEEGQFDNAAIAHYADEVLQLQTAGIEPMITLQHFTFPNWVRNHGGYEWQKIDDAMALYARIVYSKIGAGVRDWVTVNEPLVSVVAGYVAGNHPPAQKRPLQEIIPVIRGILKSHAAMYHALHQLADSGGQTIRVGMAHHLRTEDPLNRWNPLDIFAARTADQVWNWDLPNALETGRFKISGFPVIQIDESIDGLANTQDFLGINYYSGDLVTYSPLSGFKQLPRIEKSQNDLGWAIYPKGFYRLLKDASRRFPGKPILVTENGIADSNDSKRRKFILDHVFVMQKAISEGVQVEGYCHWSLMDNFEWQEGYTPRFGLYEVDYVTQERTMRPSAKVFSEIIRRNGIEQIR